LKEAWGLKGWGRNFEDVSGRLAMERKFPSGRIVGLVVGF